MMRITINTKHYNLFKLIFTCSLVLSCILLLTNQVELLIAYWIMMTSLIPPLLLIQRSRFISVKVFVWLAFLTQSVTLPFFYLYPDTYVHQSHRFFGYSGLEAFPVYARLGFFLLFFFLIVWFLERYIRLPYSPQKQYQQTNLSSSNLAKQKKPNRKRISPQLIILILIVFMIPLNWWMFSMGIGLTGIESPRLPYRLSGILSYLTKWLVPTIIAITYIRTSQRSVFLVSTLGIYGLYLGLSTVSRSAALSLIFVPALLAFIKRRWFIFSIATLIGLFNYVIITASRKIIFAASHTASSANTEQGILGSIYEASKLFDWQSLALALPRIFARMTSFEQLFLSSQVDPSAIGGGLAVWLKTLHWKIVDLGHSALHQEFLGYTPPEGFYNAAADIFSHALWASNESILFFVLFAMSSALILMLQEQAISRLAVKYSVPTLLSQGIILLLSIYVAVAPGYPFFVNIILFLLVASRIPKIRLRAN